MDSLPTPMPHKVFAGHNSRLDITSLDQALNIFIKLGIAPYLVPLKRNPFPISEIVLCYFVSFLGGAWLVPSTIRTYLAAVRHMQIRLGFPEAREVSSLPLLKLVQAGVARVRAVDGVRDLSLDSNRAPMVVKIHLKTSKCDQFGRGADVYIRQSKMSLCPVDAMVAYLRERGPREGHLFIFKD